MMGRLTLQSLVVIAIAAQLPMAMAMMPNLAEIVAGDSSLSTLLQAVQDVSGNAMQQECMFMYMYVSLPLSLSLSLSLRVISRPEIVVARRNDTRISNAMTHKMVSSPVLACLLLISLAAQTGLADTVASTPNITLFAPLNLVSRLEGDQLESKQGARLASLASLPCFLLFSLLHFPDRLPAFLPFFLPSSAAGLFHLLDPLPLLQHFDRPPLPRRAGPSSAVIAEERRAAPHGRRACFPQAARELSQWRDIHKPGQDL